MKVIEVLQSNKQVLAKCTPEEPILTVSDRLSTLNIGALPVCGAGGDGLLGILSERDIVRGFARMGGRLTERHVRDLMTREVVTCGPHDCMADAESRMDKHRTRHLPVVDRGKLVGMLSIRDVTAWRLQESRSEGNLLRDAVMAAGPR